MSINTLSIPIETDPISDAFTKENLNQLESDLNNDCSRHKNPFETPEEANGLFGNRKSKDPYKREGTNQLPNLTQRGIDATEANERISNSAKIPTRDQTDAEAIQQQQDGRIFSSTRNARLQQQYGRRVRRHRW